MTRLAPSQAGRRTWSRCRNSSAAALSALLLPTLAACGDGRLFDDAPYVGEIQPRVAAPANLTTPPELAESPRPERLPPASAEDDASRPAADDGDLGVDVSVEPPAAVADGPRLPSQVADDTRPPTPANPEFEVTDAPGTTPSPVPAPIPAEPAGSAPTVTREPLPEAQPAAPSAPVVQTAQAPTVTARPPAVATPAPDLALPPPAPPVVAPVPPVDATVPDVPTVPSGDAAAGAIASPVPPPPPAPAGPPPAARGSSVIAAPTGPEPNPPAAFEEPAAPPLPPAELTPPVAPPTDEEALTRPPGAGAPTVAQAPQPGAIPGRPGGEDVPQAASALETIPRPAVSEDYPNLADVPDRPDDLPTAEEVIALQQQLEADRDALRQGAAPPRVNPAIPDGPPTVPYGSVPRDVAPAPAPTAQQPTPPSAVATAAPPPARAVVPSAPVAPAPTAPAEAALPVPTVAPPPIAAAPPPTQAEADDASAGPQPPAAPSPPAAVEAAQQPEEVAAAPAPAPAPPPASASPAVVTASSRPSPAVDSAERVATLFFSPGTTTVGASNRAVLERVMEEQQATGRSVRIVAFSGGGGRGGGLTVPLAATARVATERAQAVAASLAGLGMSPGSMAVEAVYEAVGGGSPADAERAEIYLE